MHGIQIVEVSCSRDKKLEYKIDTRISEACKFKRLVGDLFEMWKMWKYKFIEPFAVTLPSLLCELPCVATYALLYVFLAITAV